MSSPPASPDKKKRESTVSKLRNSFTFFKRSRTTSTDNGSNDVLNVNASDEEKSIGILSKEELSLAKLLINLNQQHLFLGWDPKGVHEDKKRAFFEQVSILDKSYPGGLKAYINRAKELLEAAKNGENSLDGWVPSVPKGITLEPFSPEFNELESLGKQALSHVGFVLVAGGLGERLGYSGIKVELPVETTTHTCYIQHYIQQILAFQSRYISSSENQKTLPLAIMVSDDTYSKTQHLLEDHDYFGINKNDIYIMKQEKVAALMSADGKIAIATDYVIDTKPHGHGDVHALMHSTGTAKTWLNKGIKYIAFFQDTNGLSFVTLAAMLGVSSKLDLEVNSLSVPRKAKQAVGGIARLTKVNDPNGMEMTVNVEYNQLDPLLRATGYPEGDVNDPVTGLSPFPGNINQLIFALEPYVKTLERTGGVMGEFVNPKYADETKTVFKKPTRLECMMQDYPKALDKNAKVGFTMAPAWICYSPCKNNTSDAAASIKSGVPAGSAFTAESDQYYAVANILRMIGCHIDSADPITVAEITAIPGPRIVFHPSFAVLPSEIKAHFPHPSLVHVSARSSLVIKGDVIIHSLQLDGALKITAAPGTRLHVHVTSPIVNKGHELTLLSSTSITSEGEDYTLSEVDKMRGYRIEVVEEESVNTEMMLHPQLRLSSENLQSACKSETSTVAGSSGGGHGATLIHVQSSNSIHSDAPTEVAVSGLLEDLHPYTTDKVSAKTESTSTSTQNTNKYTGGNSYAINASINNTASNISNLALKDPATVDSSVKSNSSQSMNNNATAIAHDSHTRDSMYSVDYQSCDNTPRVNTVSLKTTTLLPTVSPPATTVSPNSTSSTTATTNAATTTGTRTTELQEYVYTGSTLIPLSSYEKANVTTDPDTGKTIVMMLFDDNILNGSGNNSALSTALLNPPEWTCFSMFKFC